MERGNCPPQNVSVLFAKSDEEDLLERWMLRQKGITLAGGDLAGSPERIGIHACAYRRKGDGLRSMRVRELERFPVAGGQEVWIAPSTPPPPSIRSLAALTITSTDIRVILRSPLRDVP